jgi:hypothetical protein
VDRADVIGAGVTRFQPILAHYLDRRPPPGCDRRSACLRAGNAPSRS